MLSLVTNVSQSEEENVFSVNLANHSSCTMFRNFSQYNFKMIGTMVSHVDIVVIFVIFLLVIPFFCVNMLFTTKSTFIQKIT